MNMAMHAASGMTGTVVSCLARMIPRRRFLAMMDAHRCRVECGDCFRPF